MTLPPSRRLIVALVLGALVATISVAAAGAASGPSDVPSHLQLPLPHGGDEARYANSDDAEGYTEHVLPEERLPGSDGRWHLVHGIVDDLGSASTSARAGSISIAQTIPIQMGAWLDSTTFQPVASIGGGGSASYASSSALPLVGTTQAQSSSTDSVDFTTEARCDLMPRLWQGVDLGGSFAVHDCSQPGSVDTVRAAGVEQVGDLQAIRLDMQVVDRHGDAARVSTFVHPGLPVPLRYRASSPDGKEVYGEQTLVGFKPGSEEWHSGLALDAETLPSVTVAPREAWGPSDAGVDHPFSLSAAWAAARDDLTYTGLRDFLASHPEARACEASYTQQTDGERTDRTWTVTVKADGGALLGFRAQQTTQPPGSDVFALLGMPSPTPTRASTSVSRISDPDHFGLCPEPREMALNLPTVASAFAAWRAFAGGADEPNSWSLSLVQDRTDLTVGRTGAVFPASSPLKPATTDGSLDDRLLRFDANGHLLGYEHVHATYASKPNGLPSPSTSASAGSGASIQPRPSIAGIITLPSAGAAAGLSLASLLVAAGYYLWPLAKGGALGLFSRVEDDRLLEHPTRRRLRDAVEAEPGIHFQALVRLVGGGQGATEHHLRKLVSAGLLVRKAGPGFTCFFPPGRQAPVVLAAPVLKSAGARSILETVRGSPGIPGVEVAALTGLDPSTVSHHVQRLQAAGLLLTIRDGRQVRLHPAAGAA